MQAVIDQIYQVEKKFSYVVKIKIFGFLINIYLNYIFIFSLKLGVGAAMGTTISYSLVMILSLYNLKNLKIDIKLINHFIWLLWLLIFNLPVIIIINIIKDYFYNDYLIIIITFYPFFINISFSFNFSLDPKKN